MCNLGEVIARESIEKGRLEGRAEGITEGILSSIKNLMETMGVSVEKAMTALKIPEAEQREE